MYVVGFFAQLICVPKLISKSAQSKIACSTRLVGVS